MRAISRFARMAGSNGLLYRPLGRTIPPLFFKASCPEKAPCVAIIADKLMRR